MDRYRRPTTRKAKSKRKSTGRNTRPRRAPKALELALAILQRSLLGAADSDLSDLEDSDSSITLTPPPAKRGRKAAKKAPKASPKPSSSKSPSGSASSSKAEAAKIDLDSDIEHAEVNTSHINQIQSKVDKFFSASAFDSDDDELPLAGSVNKSTPKDGAKEKAKGFYDLSGIDNDSLLEPKDDTADSLNVDNSDITDSFLLTETKKDEPDKKKEEEDVMCLLDKILDSDDVTTIDDGKDLQDFENFRKETEKMLNEANNLLSNFKGEAPKEEEKKKAVNASPEKSKECPICLDSLGGREVCSTTCGHVFCKGCIEEVARTTKKCPTCRKNVTLKKIHKLFL